jgi:CopG family nickel-responsive transcriptional regulator
MSSDLVRFSIAMPSDLLERFDDLVARRGIAKNRSEAIRDLVRDALVEEQCANPDEEVCGTLTMVYNHHASDLTNRLDSVQHDHCNEIISTMHIHLDPHNCLEIIAMRGKVSEIQAISDALLGLKGVKCGNLTTTTTGESL